MHDHPAASDPAQAATAAAVVHTESTRTEEMPCPISSSQANQSPRMTKLETHLYTISHLIFFSFLGTLARLGLQALTTYPAAPVVTGVCWANLTGCFIMGCMEGLKGLFELEKEESSPAPTSEELGMSELGGGRAAEEGRTQQQQHETSTEEEDAADTQQQRSTTPTDNKPTRTLPIYTGLTTGLCGCMTSFSAIMRDCFLALDDTLQDPAAPYTSGQEMKGALAILLLNVSLSLSGLQSGTHLASLLKRFLPRKLPRLPVWVHGLIVAVAGTSYFAILMLLLYQPLSQTKSSVYYSLLLAPPGCLLRYFVGKIPSAKNQVFPLGTFVVNFLGTALLGVFWDVGLEVGSITLVGCRALQGLQDGFCGALTTVSTWVVELRLLSRRAGFGRWWAYLNACTSLAWGLGIILFVVGKCKWREGYVDKACTILLYDD